MFFTYVSALPVVFTFVTDLHYALRQLAKTPAFTAIAIVTLALGTGANTALFSLADALFLKPLPVQGPYRIVGVYGSRNGKPFSASFSYPDCLYYQKHNSVFSELAADYSTSPLNLVAAGDSREVEGAVVSANYFRLLDLKPLMGRFFSADDRNPGRGAVAVLGYGLWQGRFGGDPAILGKTIRHGTNELLWDRR